MLFQAGPYNNNTNDEPITSERGTEGAGTPGTPTGPEGKDWLQIARDAYSTSESWFDSAVRKDVERNVAHFQNRHAPGSKYYSDLYKYRSKGFRPKTRAVVRKNEALAANAFFATSNLLVIRAEDESNIVQRVSAEIVKELMEYRLKNTTLWYQTLIGAYQDSLVSGPCISYQYWDFQESAQEVPIYDETTGEAILDEDGQPAFREEYRTVKDTFDVMLRPLENVRFAPSADWRDPVNSSPFLIDRIPMFIGDVLTMTKRTGKSKIPWRETTKGTLLQAGASRGSGSDDSVKRQRERGGLDPSVDTSYTHREFDTVWVHRNIMRQDGRDWIYYTAGDYFMLSDPIPLEEEYPWLKPNERPYVMGASILEAHNAYPQPLAGISASLQQQVNDLANQRFDNVSLVLNRRFYVKRSQGVDIKALQRNVPGGVVLVNNVDQDVRSEAPNDVTSSSYAEQDRMNADFDEVAGNFSVASVGTNRQLNETVGGMELMSGDADIIGEYQLRTFNETWVERVLRQLVRLEQYYETDEAILAMVGKKVQMWERFGVSQIQDDMLQGSMTVEVNVGFGSTNPTQRIQRLSTGIGTLKAFAPNLASRLDEEEIAKEIFGSMGYKDGSRFIVPEVPEEEQPEPPMDPQIQLEYVRAEAKQQQRMMEFEFEMQLEQFRAHNEQMKLQFQMEQNMSGNALKMSIEEQKMGLEQEKLMRKSQDALQKHKVRLAEQAIKQRNENARFNREISAKDKHGTGI
jgi:hypothetical protein